MADQDKPAGDGGAHQSIYRQVRDGLDAADRKPVDLDHLVYVKRAFGSPIGNAIGGYVQPMYEGRGEEPDPRSPDAVFIAAFREVLSVLTRLQRDLERVRDEAIAMCRPQLRGVASKAEPVPIDPSNICQVHDSRDGPALIKGEPVWVGLDPARWFDPAAAVHAYGNIMRGGNFAIAPAAPAAPSGGASWLPVAGRLACLDLGEQDKCDLYAELQRVFGAAPDSAEQACKWLDAHSGPCRGKPMDVLAGKVPGVPKEIGVPRVISYLRDAPDGPKG